MPRDSFYYEIEESNTDLQKIRLGDKHRTKSQFKREDGKIVGTLNGCFYHENKLLVQAELQGQPFGSVSCVIKKGGKSGTAANNSPINLQSDEDGSASPHKDAKW